MQQSSHPFFSRLSNTPSVHRQTDYEYGKWVFMSYQTTKTAVKCMMYAGRLIWRINQHYRLVYVRFFFLSPFYRREANNVSGEVIFSLQKDVKSSDGGVLSLLHHADVATLRKSRGSPLADPLFCHRWRHFWQQKGAKPKLRGR